MDQLVKRSAYTNNDLGDAFQVYKEDTPPVLQENSYVPTRVYSKGFFGYDTPNFHRRVKAGELIPMTPFGQFEISGSTSGFTDITYTIGHYYSVGNCSRSQDWVITHDDIEGLLQPEDAAMYLQEAAAKIYSSSYDLLTAVAELAETRRLFLDTGKRMLSYLGKLPRGVSLRKVSGRWLALRYGWRTLLYDIQDLIKMINSFDDKRTRYSERAGKTDSYTETTTDIINWAYITNEIEVTDVITKGVRGSVVADISLPKIQINPIMTGWELIPFSFVIDWFVSVGKALAAAHFLMLQSNYTSALGTSAKIERTLTWRQVGWTSSYISGSTEQDASCIATYIRRHPSPVPVFPQLRLKLDAFKIADLLALILQRIR